MIKEDLVNRYKKPKNPLLIRSLRLLRQGSWECLEGSIPFTTPTPFGGHLKDSLGKPYRPFRKTTVEGVPEKTGWEYFDFFKEDGRKIPSLTKTNG